LLDKLIRRLEGKSEIAYYEIGLIIFCACLPELYYLFFIFVNRPLRTYRRNQQKKKKNSNDNNNNEG